MYLKSDVVQGVDPDWITGHTLHEVVGRSLKES